MHISSYPFPSFLISLSSRLIAVVENFKDFEYPLTNLETNPILLLGARTLLHMVQVLFEVRQVIQNIT